jgi:WD40 repeat protein
MKLRRKPVVIGKVLDAPEVIDEFPAQLISFSHRNHLAVALGTAIYIWDDGNVTELTKSDLPITGLCWADGGLVVSAGGSVHLWDVNRSKKSREITRHIGRCGTIAFGGGRLATGGSDTLVKLSDLRAPTVTTMAGHHDEVSGLSWSPNGVNVASGGCDSRVIMWGDQRRRSYDLHGPVQGLHYINPSLLAIGAMDPAGTLTIVHGRQDDVPLSIGTGAPMSGLVFAERWGLFLAHQQTSFSWEIWSPEFKKVAQYQGHTADILNIAASPDGSCVATIGADETLQMWELRDGKARTPSFNGKRPELFTVSLPLR